LIQGDAWVSTRKSLPKSHDDTEEDFIESQDWQEYLARHRPDNMLVTLVVDDRKRFMLRKHDSKDGHLHVSIGVPAEMFLGDESKQDVYREIKLRTYTWLAERLGWPPPPPLPPLTVKRTYRKNYRPPEPEAPSASRA